MPVDNTMRVLKNPSTVVLLLVLCSFSAKAQPSLSGSDDFLAAYARKDFKTALKLVRPMAEEGNTYAQFTIGKMFANGEGVNKDYQKAALWYQKAAEQGMALAQYQL